MVPNAQSFTVPTALLLLAMVSTTQAQKPLLGLPIGHKEEIIHLSFSADGKYVLSASMGELKLWDVQSGKPLKSTNEKGASDFATLSPDAQKVYFGSGVTDLIFYTWNIDKNQLEMDEEATGRGFRNDSPAESMANKIFAEPFQLAGFYISCDQTQAIAYNPDGLYKVADLKTQKVLSEGNLPFPGPSGIAPYFMASQDPDGFDACFGFRGKTPLMVVQKAKNTLEVWDLTNNTKLQTISESGTTYRLAALSPDGLSLAASDRKQIQHWDLQTGKKIKTFAAQAQSIAGPVFQPVANGIYVGLNSGIRYWNFETGSISNTWPGANTLGEGLQPAALHVKPVAYLDIWENGKSQKKQLPGLGKICAKHDCEVVLSNDLKKAIVQVHNYDAGDSCWVWDLEKDRQLFFLNRYFISVSPDMRFGVAKEYVDNQWQSLVWSFETGNKIFNIPQQNGNPDDQVGFTFSKDGQYVLYSLVETYTDFGTYSLVNMQSHQKQNTFTLEGKGAFTRTRLSPDNKFALVAGQHSEAPIELVEIGTGKVIRSFSGQKGGITALDFSADGKQVFAAAADHSLRIWEINSGKESISLVAMGERDWVALNNDGLFDASPAAMQEMYYIQGREVIELEQLKERYYEPGLLSKTLGYSKGAIRDVSIFNQVDLYPVISAQLNGEKLDIQLKARSGGLGQLSFFIDGIEVAADINPGRTSQLSIDLKAYEGHFLSGSNTLALRAYNRDGWLKSPAYEITYVPAALSRGSGSSTPAPMFSAKPHLYAILVGTSDYSGTQLDLRYPDLDAIAMAQALESVGKRLFEDRTHFRLLTTSAQNPADISSKANIAAAFKDFAALAKPSDVMVVYFSGHGLTYGSAEKSQFYYLTKDVASPDLKDPSVRDNFTVSSEDFTRWLATDIKAKKRVMILDACNSGKVVESLLAVGARELNSSQIRALDRMKDRTGMFILTGAAADKVSFEASQYGQGLLTYSLLQGMSGLALTSDKRVDVMTLFQYARDKVPELASSIQQVQIPVLSFPVGASSFDIGIVDATVKIKLAQVKPVFIRNVFQDEDSFDDNLGLTSALAEYFQKTTARGSSADLIYVDVSEYENAYSIKGRYSLKGDAVTVRGRLYQGKNSRGEFQVNGVKSAMPALVEELIKKVMTML